MSRFFAILLVSVLLLAGCERNPIPTAILPSPTAGPSPLPDSWPTQDWPVAAPESQGMDSKKLAQMLAYIHQQAIDLHSLLVIRNGFLVSETYFAGYEQDTPHKQFSCTKSFISTLVGIAIAQGKISNLDQATLSFFPAQQFENIDKRKQAMTLENLLTMTSGLDWEEGDQAYRAMYSSSDWAKQVLDLPMRADPGSSFNYCSGCSHILSSILQVQTGMPTQEFAAQNLFAPLGITGYTWDTDAAGNAIGGWGLSLTPRQMAKLGYLYLHMGMWNGQQIIPQSWVETATQIHISTGDGKNGYGYQWWVYPDLGGYSALGRGGQTIFVAPALNLIVVTTAELDGHDKIFRLLDGYILPSVISP